MLFADAAARLGATRQRGLLTWTPGTLRHLRLNSPLTVNQTGCPATRTAALQIQADLGFGHEHVIKAYEAVLTPTHLCLGGLAWLGAAPGSCLCASASSAHVAGIRQLYVAAGMMQMAASGSLTSYATA